jgi:hypothetical protein
VIEVYVADRQRGKTTALLEWARSAPEGEHRIVVCESEQRAMDLLREEYDREDALESWQFVGIREVTPTAWSGVLRGRGGRVVLGIDDLDLVLHRLLGIGFVIGAIAMTGVPMDVPA